MNKKIIIKFLIDILMFILFILELNLNITGLYLHEILGLVLGIVIIIHLYLNSLWIKSIFKNNIKNNKLKTSIILNTLLLISVIIMILTGVIISKNLFSFNIKNDLIISKIHKLSSYISFIIILIHILLHFKYLKNIIIKILKSDEISLGKKILLIISLLILGTSLTYTVVNKLFYKTNLLKTEINKKEDEIIIKEENIIEEEINDKTEPKPTLEEYLSKLFCNGCGRHCSLLSPRCGRGREQAEKAKIEYNEKY